VSVATAVDLPARDVPFDSSSPNNLSSPRLTDFIGLPLANPPGSLPEHSGAQCRFLQRFFLLFPRKFAALDQA
jgi:hypothetical protein